MTAISSLNYWTKNKKYDAIILELTSIDENIDETRRPYLIAAYAAYLPEKSTSEINDLIDTVRIHSSRISYLASKEKWNTIIDLCLEIKFKHFYNYYFYLSKAYEKTYQINKQLELLASVYNRFGTSSTKLFSEYNKCLRFLGHDKKRIEIAKTAYSKNPNYLSNYLVTLYQSEEHHKIEQAFKYLNFTAITSRVLFRLYKQYFNYGYVDFCAELQQKIASTKQASPFKEELLKNIETFFEEEKRKRNLQKEIIQEKSPSCSCLPLADYQLQDFEKDHLRDQIEQLTTKYKIAVVIELNEASKLPDVKWTFENLQQQMYPFWELIISIQFGTPTSILQYLIEKKQAYSFKYFYQKKESTIHALATSIHSVFDADYIGFISIGNGLLEDALFRIAERANKSTTHLFYSFNLEYCKCGNYIPIHKPTYNYAYLLDTGYVNGLIVIDQTIWRTLVSTCSYLVEEKENSLLDLVFAYIELANSKDLPDPEYVPSAGYIVNTTRQDKQAVSKQSIQNHIERYTPEHPVKVDISTDALLSIVIPFKDKVELLKVCLASLFDKTNYKNFEVILINNNSVELETKEYLSELTSRRDNIYILDYNFPFNYSRMNNWAVQHAAGELILLLNNDMEILAPNWITNMLSLLRNPQVGIVGAKLLFPDGTIQHAGGKATSPGWVDHPYSGEIDDKNNLPINSIKYVDFVTGACLMIPKLLYIALGGLEEKHMPIGYSDIDLCFKARMKGYKVGFTPKAQILHYESKSRGKVTNFKASRKTHEEAIYFRNKWLNNFQYLSNLTP